MGHKKVYRDGLSLLELNSKKKNKTKMNKKEEYKFIRYGTGYIKNDDDDDKTTEVPFIVYRKTNKKFFGVEYEQSIMVKLDTNYNNSSKLFFNDCYGWYDLYSHKKIDHLIVTDLLISRRIKSIKFGDKEKID